MASAAEGPLGAGWGIPAALPSHCHHPIPALVAARGMGSQEVSGAAKYTVLPEAFLTTSIEVKWHKAAAASILYWNSNESMAKIHRSKS